MHISDEFVLVKGYGGLQNSDLWPNGGAGGDAPFQIYTHYRGVPKSVHLSYRASSSCMQVASHGLGVVVPKSTPIGSLVKLITPPQAIPMPNRACAPSIKKSLFFFGGGGTQICAPDEKWVACGI